MVAGSLRARRSRYRRRAIAHQWQRDLQRWAHRVRWSGRGGPMTGRLVFGYGPRPRGSPRRRRCLHGTVPATYAVSGYVSRRAGVRRRRRSCSSSHGAS
ncbi:uncharacterized protein SCHCODRAFT_02328960 [Schizophyllum commune H4-8]|uniref:uncharacterized protein n=1 Tax=Schizophyllum commune (strain H4-8 / FGSC 9210) TaxID=578458 RepID=UPI00215FB1B0|nr:uncharacterized protein SCHCODRAFT_02328960 [Schizophyllum commune H4-8]KAI5891778.1 hypothetical protein SCHCODRAFT_02328960 [Schizophyllum commune H4-8]